MGKPLIEHGIWQCSGCRKAFVGWWQKTCPNCKRDDCWTGSVEPAARANTLVELCESEELVLGLLDVTRVANARLIEENSGLRAENELRGAQLLMVGSELAADPKLDPVDKSDPRWTPTLELAANLRADNERLKKQCAELQEIALRVKDGQLEVWPDASMTRMGIAYREVSAENGRLLAQAEADVIRREIFDAAVNETTEFKARLAALREAAENAYPYIDDAAWRKELRDALLQAEAQLARESECES